MKPLILVIDDEIRYRQLYSETLEKAGFRVVTAESAEAAAASIAEQVPAMVVSDVRMPGRDGISFLEETMKENPNMPYLLITAYADIREAVNALKLGAIDYLEKPVDLDELVAAVEDALGIVAPFQQDDLPRELLTDIIAESPLMKSLLRDAYRVAKSDATVLISGESGTGKEVLATFIHRCGIRNGKPLVTLNCAAMPASILGSELFGHEKGAFTGAVAKRNGRFREADQGTLFLDEIGDMPLELQPALLRAIEAGVVTPVGSDSDIQVDCRLIAATNKDLLEEVEHKRFREDLYYRLNVISFELPPLRERPEDILPLAHFFLERKKDGWNKRLSPSASTILRQHSWPGNTRELANAIERASILANTEVILPDHLPPALVRNASMNPQPDVEVKTMADLETDAILAALEKTGGNRTKAAELLGISRRALLYKLKRMS